MHDLHRGAAQAHLVARVTRKEHLVAGFDTAGLTADGSDDAGAAVRLARGRDDQPEVRLRLLVRWLDDDEVVERLQGKVDPARLRLLHAIKVTGGPDSNRRPLLATRRISSGSQGAAPAARTDTWPHASRAPRRFGNEPGQALLPGAGTD